MTVEIYRLRLSKGTASSGSGHWEYYEDFERLERDLLEAAIEAHGRDHDRRALGLWLACRAWLEHVFRKDPSDYGVRRVVAVERLHDDEWVEMRWTLQPPSIQIWRA